MSRLLVGRPRIRTSSPLAICQWPQFPSHRLHCLQPSPLASCSALAAAGSIASPSGFQTTPTPTLSNPTDSARFDAGLFDSRLNSPARSDFFILRLVLNLAPSSSRRISQDQSAQNFSSCQKFWNWPPSLRPLHPQCSPPQYRYRCSRKENRECGSRPL